MNRLLSTLGIRLPVIQAPMAGVSTPDMAAAVSNEGGLGSLGLGNVDATTAQALIHEVRSKTDQPFNVNLFCHKPAVSHPDKETAWLEKLRPYFDKFDAKPPTALHEIYKSFLVDDDMFEVLLAERPPVVSFHFGIPSDDCLQALKSAGIKTLATATSLEEAERISRAGIDAVVAQGYEAGGHRGIFDPDTNDEQLSTLVLTRLIVKNIEVSVIAAGGIMDGAGIAAALAVGAEAAQLGTAFILCPESAADEGYRQALLRQTNHQTIMTKAISGRPARSLVNRFTALGEKAENIPDYPIAYDAGKALNAAARAKGEYGYGAQWAGQGATLVRKLPAGELVQQLWKECSEAIRLNATR